MTAFGYGFSHTGRSALTAFSPASIFSASETGVWYDPNALSTVWQDSARTIPGAVGAVVGCLDDRSGNGKHARQSGPDSLKPILRQSGGRYYLDFDGVDDFLVTASINLTGTDAITVFAGIRKERDATTAALVEFSTTATTTPGAFALFAPGTAGDYYRWRFSGTLFQIIEQTGFASNIVSVLTGYGDISADVAGIRHNGALIGASTTDSGAGNLSNNPLYIGMRAGASLPFKGRFYGLIVLGRLASTSEMSAVERWMLNRVQREVAMVGSSIASGQVASVYANSVGGLLGAALPHRTVVNYGVPGRSSSTLVTDFPAILKHKPSQVILLTTLYNDGYYGTGVEAEKRVILNAWKANISNCIAQAQAAGSEVVMCSPPPNDFNTPLDVMLMEEVRAWIATLGVPWVDLFLAGNDGNGHWLPDHKFDDNHPNDTGHSALFNAFNLADFT